MKRQTHPFRALWRAGVVLFLLSPAIRSQDKPGYEPRIDKDGWEILFDGKDLTAWTVPKATWEINDSGELHPIKPGRSLFTKRRYCDFVLELDFKVASKKKSNSGVFLHTHDTNQEVNTGFEVQILDKEDHNLRWDAMNANGALYELVHPSVDANKPLGEWNHYRITFKGYLIEIDLNEKNIVKADLSRWDTPQKNPDGKHNKFPFAIGSLPLEGFIGLQNHGGTPVWFRNVRVKPLTDRKPKYTGAEPIKAVLHKPGEE